MEARGEETLERPLSSFILFISHECEGSEKGKSQKYEEKHRGPRSESLSIADVALAADVAE